MKLKGIFTFYLALACFTLAAQNQPVINLSYSRLFSTYEYVKKLSAEYPGNVYKDSFKTSAFNRKAYTDLLAQFDTLNIYYAFDYPGYPIGQKMSVATTSIIQRNLIYSNSINAFKKESFGIIPVADMLAFANIIDKFATVYDSLVYIPHRKQFEDKIAALQAFVEQTQLAKYFENGLQFYNTAWDFSIPIDIAIVPSIEEGGFTGTAFFNNAVSEVPLNFNENDALFTVLMHEIYHTLYNEESLAFKKQLKGWFSGNSSANSQYAFLLLNEALATALGNGYVFEQINGHTDTEAWYNVKYIDQMAQKIYPTVKQYLKEHKPMDKQFVDTYIALYDQYFPAWTTEPAHIFHYRYILTDEEQDFSFFRKNFRRATYYAHETGVSPNNLERMREQEVTKVIIVSSDHAKKLKWIQQAFPELKNWKFDASKEFVYSSWLKDRTKIFIVNKLGATTEKIFEKNTLLPEQK